MNMVISRKVQMTKNLKCRNGNTWSLKNKTGVFYIVTNHKENAPMLGRFLYDDFLRTIYWLSRFKG